MSYREINDSSVCFEDCGSRFRGRIVEVTQSRTQAVVSITHYDDDLIPNPEDYAYMVVPLRQLRTWYEM